jgi:hypothetical protein
MIRQLRQALVQCYENYKRDSPEHVIRMDKNSKSSLQK